MAWMWENVKKEQERCWGWVEMLMRTTWCTQWWEGLLLPRTPSAPPRVSPAVKCGSSPPPGFVGTPDWVYQWFSDSGSANSHVVPSHAFALMIWRYF